MSHMPYKPDKVPISAIKRTCNYNVVNKDILAKH